MGNSLWLGVQYPFEGYSAEKLLFIMRLPEYRQYINVQAELKKLPHGILIPHIYAAQASFCAKRDR